MSFTADEIQSLNDILDGSKHSAAELELKKIEAMREHTRAHQERSRFNLRGQLKALGVEKDAARIRIDHGRIDDERNDHGPDREEMVLLPFDDIAAAKLVLTDELIAASLRRGKSAERAARRAAPARSPHPARRHEQGRRASGAPPAASRPEGE